jgi:formylglycine-generating enzyme required for sulfatase activity
MTTQRSLNILARNLTLGPCGLLGYIAEHRNDKDLQQSFHTLLDEKVLADPSLFNLSDTESLLPLVAARAELIRCALFLTSDDRSARQAIEKAMREVIVQTQIAWSYDPVAYLVQTPGCEPSFLPFDAGYQKFENILKDLSQEYGWNHPGLLMLGETLAILFGSRRQPTLTVHTKILFAAPQRGVIARLTIEQVRGPRGASGLLIPDPIRCGYLWMEKSFSDGLQNALWAARKYSEKKFGSKSIEFDWRWSIDLLSDFKKAKVVNYPIQIKLTGRSGEVAIACGLIGAHPGNPDNRSPGGKWIDPIDPHVGATASILYPGDSTKDALKPVDSIDDKTLVDRMYSSRLVEIVVAESQPTDSLPADERYSFETASSLGEAYGLMTHHHRITRGLNRFFHRWSKEHLDKQCTPWITPDIQEVVAPEERNALVEKQDLRAAATKPLDEDLELLFRGKLQEGTDLQRAKLSKNARRKRWIGNRVRIFADSGLGKSMLMLWCEYRASSPGSAYLPLRLGRTTGEDGGLDIRWNEGDFLTKLVGRSSITNAFTAFLEENPQANALDIDARSKWLHSMLRKGCVVFLIDALDQIVTDVEGLGSFLASDLVKRCPVVLTGRPESALNRSQAFVNNRWRTLRVMPFDHARRVRYLGDELAAEILLDDGNKGVDWSTSQEDLRKHQWKELVKVPLLLNLIKRLASGQEGTGALKEIHSRHDLYDLAVKELIQQGWRSAKDQDKALLLDEFEIRGWLERIAWAMVVNHDFSNVFEGTRFGAFRREMDAQGGGNHPGSLLNALKQVDLTTDYQVLDRADAAGLAFRHRSFLEYFAACHWMAVDEEINTKSGKSVFERRMLLPDRLEVLEEIHGIRDGGSQDESVLKRLGDWQDTLRFALGHPNVELREDLAKQLISFGNPWIVYQSIKRDRVEFSPGLESACRWLVHRDSPIRFEYRDAISETDRDADEIHREANEFVTKRDIDPDLMLDRRYRDGAYLSSLRELIGDKPFHQAYSKDSEPRESLKRLPRKDGEWNFLESFYRIDGGVFEYGEEPKEVAGKKVQVASFQMADFPVTNALFELFCPSHRRERNEYSNQDDDPVLYVSWYMAMEFCDWLSTITGQNYGLPTDYEWEWAVRGSNKDQAYWWGDQVRKELVWCSESGAKTTRSRSEAIEAHSSREGLYHPTKAQKATGCGLLDLHGNVWEWTSNSELGKSYNRNDSEGSPRFLVGGSWGDYAVNSRCGGRNNRSPDLRNIFIGFRIVLR